MQVEDDVVRQQMARCTDNELRIAVTTDAANYHPEALVIAREELARRGIEEPKPAEAEALKLQQERDIPVRWLKFYTYIRLPIVMLLSLFPFFDDTAAGITLFVTLNAVRVLVLVGLHRRTLWGWKLNFPYLATTVLLSAWYGSSTVAGRMIGVLVWSVLWGVPNYLYFKRRRHLFH